MGRKTRISLRTQDHWATRRIREHSCGELVLFAGLSDLGAGEWRLSSTVGSRYQPQSCSPSISKTKAPASLHPICPSCGISVALRKRSCCGIPHTTHTTARQFHATRHIHPDTCQAPAHSDPRGHSGLPAAQTALRDTDAGDRVGCFSLLATVFIAVFLGPQWYYAIPVAILGLIVTLYRYRTAQQLFQQWEDEMRDWHRYR